MGTILEREENTYMLGVQAGTRNREVPKAIFGSLKLMQLIKDRRGLWPDQAIGPTVL